MFNIFKNKVDTTEFDELYQLGKNIANDNRDNIIKYQKEYIFFLTNYINSLELVENLNNSNVKKQPVYNYDYLSEDNIFINKLDLNVDGYNGIY